MGKENSETIHFAPAYQRYHNLCSRRIHLILLVASDYDAFAIAEDGMLGARLFLDSSEFYQLNAPRFVHATTPEEAFKILEGHRVDLVLNTLSPFNGEGGAFLKDLKAYYPYIPAVQLILDEAEWRQHFVHALPPGVDWAFFWTGDQRLVSAIVRLIEDADNVKADTQSASIQVILAVEDSIRSYSLFLSYLYEELMVQSRSLAAEGVNLGHRALRMLTRPKILLARNYEEAQELFAQYSPYIMALITDVQFDREGADGEEAGSGEEAGFCLARFCTERRPGLPVLMHSAEPGFRKKAEDLGYHFSLKNSDLLHAAISSFMSESLGFGDFVFRLPDRTEVGRARDTYELVRLLHSVNTESLYYHAAHHHFNVWLRARSLFGVADQVRELEADAFCDRELLRQTLIAMLQNYTQEESAGLIYDYTARSPQDANHLLKVGGGSMGGKGRGIAFLHSRLQYLRSRVETGRLSLAVPRTVVLGTDVYDGFLQHNNLDIAELVEHSDGEIWERLQHCQLPPEIENDLWAAVNTMHGPLIVRSSSLLEDSQHQPCAGLYYTCLVRHNSGNWQRDAQELRLAVMRVYMSTFSQRAREYFANTIFAAEEEKMAVVIQELAGTAHGSLFYPQCAGVGVSYNYYPQKTQSKEDGVIALCLGLGHGVVEGGRCVRFSPRWPRLLPHLFNSESFLDYSQRDFYAFDLSDSSEQKLRQYPLTQAEKDGTLAAAASVFTENGTWRDGLAYEGVLAVTFSDMLRREDLALAKTLDNLLQTFQRSLGCVAEFEFALVLEPQPTLYLLQLRPQMRGSCHCDMAAEPVDPQRVICASDCALGHGRFEEIKDLVWVRHRELGYREARLAAAEVARVNAQLTAEGRSYVLIGPGRWGSADPSLGIPVEVNQIMGAKVIVELPCGERCVEPSQGSHFFHELSALNVGYITVTEQARWRCRPDDRCFTPGESREGGKKGDAQFLDWLWLSGRRTAGQGEFVSHIALDSPLRITVGCEGGAVIAWT